MFVILTGNAPPHITTAHNINVTWKRFSFPLSRFLLGSIAKCDALTQHFIDRYKTCASSNDANSSPHEELIIQHYFASASQGYINLKLIFSVLNPITNVLKWIQRTWSRWPSRHGLLTKRTLIAQRCRNIFKWAQSSLKRMKIKINSVVHVKEKQLSLAETFVNLHSPYRREQIN